MTKVIFNADDFGYSNAVNYGIIDSHKYGILSSTTLMTNMPAVEHAVLLAKSVPTLGIGVHLTLTCGKPLKRKSSTLTDENGDFKKQSFYLKEFKIDLDELYEEWDEQIKKFLSLGLKPTHLDSHHHSHTFGNNLEVAMDLARKYSLPLRNSKNMLCDHPDILHTEDFIDDFDLPAFAKEYGWSDQKKNDFINEKYNDILKCDVVEVMCHPAYIDTPILTGSSFNIQRCSEVDLLTNSDFAKKIKESNDIEIITYNQI